MKEKDVKKSLLLVISFIVALVAPSAQAALIFFQGGFSATYAGGPLASTGLSGSFEAQFDDTAVDPSLIVQTFQNQAITTLTLNPNPFAPGGTIFDTSNVGINLRFILGDLDELNLGGFLNNVGTIIVGTDDFRVDFFGGPIGGSTTPFNAIYGATGESTNFQPISLEGELRSSDTPFTSVPSPPTFTLIVIGLAGLGVLRRRFKFEDSIVSCGNIATQCDIQS